MNKRKRTWTVRSALNWIDRVDAGLELWGLKRCSAASFLRSIYGSLERAREMNKNA